MGSMVESDLSLYFRVGLWVCIFIGAFTFYSVGVCIVVDSFFGHSLDLDFIFSTLGVEVYVH